MTNTARKTPAAARKALLVRLGETLCAIPIEFVEEVLPALPLDPVPHSPAFVRGVVFVRGHLIPVLSAAERLGLANYVRPLEPPIVCLSVGGRLIGVEVDEALDLVEIDRGVYADAGELGAGENYVAGLLELDHRLIRVLNPEKLLAREAAAQRE